MDYENKYNQLHKLINDLYPHMSDYCKEKVEGFFPELKENEDEKIRKTLISNFNVYKNSTWGIISMKCSDIIAWLEKQGVKLNPYSGISFEYNGHVWGMCARDNGIDILLDKQLFKHLEKQDEQSMQPNNMSIKEKAHQIAWETSKHYDPNTCKQEWCEMAALDMADWMKNQDK